MSDVTIGYNDEEVRNKKVVCGVLGILLGPFGIHKFVLGYTSTGVIMLLVTLLTFGVGAAVMYVIGLIEGITYLLKTEREFYDTYMANEKNWF
ncbi:MAG: TM2 domain-containing protein [Phycisphaerales bacterium]|nr:TM2 domain-containing protein [Phycisphaerales bacterium]